MEDKVYRPLVCISSAFAGDVAGNIKKARKYCRFAVNQGQIPVAPHLLFPQFMDDGDPTERELAMFFGQVLLGKCKELWVFGEISEGMKQEIEVAKRRRQPIRYFNSNCEEVVVE